jgi:lipopolysaccharide transport system ATP-binding protein
MNAGEYLIHVNGVSKKFCRSLKKSLWYGVQDIGRELTGRSRSNRSLRQDEFWALDKVSFRLRRGECLGLIGKNGAGKSTLLKLLNGIIKPDSGRIELHGRVGALIELSTGFNPILSGRENIFINGSVLGFSKKDITKKLDSIIDFSEIGEFIDMPVKNYSSGMRLRLGFAVAANMDPDILLIDEVLAVGDMGFVMKCLNSIDQILRKAAVVFVSHNMPHIARICSHIMVMEKGKALFYDRDIAKGIDLYFSKFDISAATEWKSGKAEILDLRLGSSGETQIQNGHFTIKYLQDLQIDLDLKIDPQYHHPYVNLIFFDKQVRNVADCLMRNGDNVIVNKGNVISLKITIPRFCMTKGIYSLTVIVVAQDGGEVLLRYESNQMIQVTSPFIGGSPIQLKGEWRQRA